MTRISKAGVFALIFSIGCAGVESTPPEGDSPAPAPTTTEPAPAATQKALDTPVTGTIDGQPFTGRFRITRFVRAGNGVSAEGTIVPDAGATAQLPNDVVEGLRTNVVRTAVAFDAAGPGVTCDILQLQTGAIDLNILGVVLHIDPINIDLDAETGPNALLGNLLCALTALLDPVAILANLAQIITILNQIIDLIGVLTP